jgi:hypothetical protein
VQGENHCGSGYFSPVFVFFTGGTCAPLVIDVPDGGSITHTFQVDRTETVGDVDLLLHSNHPRLGDLDVRLEHGATSVQLMAPGGCALGGMEAHFDNQAETAIAAACLEHVPAVSGSVRPQQSMASFNGASMQGEWTLRLADTVANGQAGRVISGCLQPKSTTATDTALHDGLEDW